MNNTIILAYGGPITKSSYATSYLFSDHFIRPVLQFFIIQLFYQPIFARTATGFNPKLRCLTPCSCDLQQHILPFPSAHLPNPSLQPSNFQLPTNALIRIKMKAFQQTKVLPELSPDQNSPSRSRLFRRIAPLLINRS